MPQNQMESLLVEKIAVDFWRLRRVIRYEAGSIAKYLETIFKDFYTYGKKKSNELEKEILQCRDYIEWIDAYVKYLKKEEVDFSQPEWEGRGVTSDIADDFSLIVQNLDSISYEEKQNARYGDYDYAQLKVILREHDYVEKKKISKRLLEIYEQEKKRMEKEIADLEQKVQKNVEADNLNTMLGAIPDEPNADKILKYERSLQKSIYQNLFLLKKLQGLF